MNKQNQFLEKIVVNKIRETSDEFDKYLRHLSLGIFKRTSDEINRLIFSDGIFLQSSNSRIKFTMIRLVRKAVF